MVWRFLAEIDAWTSDLPVAMAPGKFLFVEVKIVAVTRITVVAAPHLNAGAGIASEECNVRLLAIGGVRAGPVGARSGGLVPSDLEVWAPRLVTLGHSLLYTKPLRESQTYRATHGDQDGGTLPVTSEA